MNDNERKIFEKYEAMGYDCIIDGKPDMIILKDELPGFIEIKYLRDKLNPAQERAFKLLEKHGIPVRVERVPKVIRSKLLEEWNKEHGADHTGRPKQTSPSHAIPSHPRSAQSTHPIPFHNKPRHITPGHPKSPQTTPFHARPAHSTPNKSNTKR